MQRPCQRLINHPAGVRSPGITKTENTKTMKTSTAVNHVTRLKSRIDSIYSSAEFYCPTCKELIATVNAEIQKDPAWGKLPSWARQAVNAQDQARFDRIQRDFTIWLFPQPEGPALSWDEMPEEIRRTYCSAEKTGKTYWLRHVTPSQAYAHTRGKRSGNHLVRTLEITSKEW